jgi:hypothetical protein
MSILDAKALAYQICHVMLRPSQLLGVESVTATSIKNRAGDQSFPAQRKPVDPVQVEKSAFFAPDSLVEPVGFPADVLIARRPISSRLVTVVIPNPADQFAGLPGRAVRGKVKRPARPPSAKSRKSVARRKKVQTPDRKSRTAPKATAAARPIAAPPAHFAAAAAAPPSPVFRADRVAPLARAAAVTVYRKNSLVDILGFWLRRSGATLTSYLSSTVARKRRKTQVDSLVAENAALRAELARVCAGL